MKSRPSYFNRKFLTLLTGIIAALMTGSCNRYALYQRQGANDSLNVAAAAREKVLMPGDKISLSIWSHEDLSIGSIHNVYAVPEENGKWVMLNESGEVNLPQVGRINLQGLTVSQAEDRLATSYSQFIRKPILNLRLLNNYVTVLGEVQKPGNYYFSSDQKRLVDVLGQANGLNDYAKTTQIKIVRGKESIPVDLTTVSNNDVMVYPQDVIYVPPSRNKVIDRIASKLIPIASLITAVALVYSVSEN